MQILGLDIGFGFTKATNGKEFHVFKSILGEAVEIQFKENLLTASGKPRHLHIETEKGAWFIGELAERQSTGCSYTLDQNQFVAEYAQTLGLTALAPLVDTEKPVQLVTGLPISYYRRHKDELARLLQQRHRLQLVNADGVREEKIIDIHKVRVIPQPFGSVFHLMLNDIGKPAEQKFLTEKVAVVDVGFRTADYTICDSTRYSERGSVSTDSGISQAFLAVANILKEKSGVNIEIYRLYEAIERGSIKIRCKRYDVKPLIDQAFRQLGSKIATEANRAWVDDWDVDSIIITGGGGATLAPYIEQHLEGEVLTIPADCDARLNNVSGYWKFGVNQWAE